MCGLYTKVPHSTQVVTSNQYIRYETYSCNTMAESLSICSISMHLDILYISILKDNSFLKYDKQIFAFLCLFSNDKTSHSLYIKKLMTDNIESSRNRLSNPKICLKLIRSPISFSITSHKGFTYLHSNNKCSIVWGNSQTSHLSSTRITNIMSPTFGIPLLIQFLKNRTFFFLFIDIAINLFPHNCWCCMVFIKSGCPVTNALL